MYIRIIPSIIVSCVCLVQGAFADIIVLTNGEKIEGCVLREEGENYVLEVKVSGTIKDEKIVAKSDVKFIEKETDDQKAFKKIVDLVPTPELLNVEGYGARIEIVQVFVEKYPTSVSAPKAKKMLDTLNEELEIIRLGGIKFGDELVAAEIYNSNAYEFDSMIAGKAIDEAISRRDFLRALRLFTEYEKTFSDAAGRADVAARISQVLTAYGAKIDEALASFDSRMKKREAGLASMAVDNRATTEGAIADEIDRLEARFQQEKEEKATWITPDANHKGSLEQARSQVDREVGRLESKSRNKALDTPLEETYRGAWSKLTDTEKEINSGDEEEVEIDVEQEAKAAAERHAKKKAVLDELTGLRMPDVYMEKLRIHAGLLEN